MEAPYRPSRCRYLWTGLAVLTLTAFIAFVGIPKSLSSKRLVIHVGTNGIPQLLGISMTNINVRDHVFRALGAVRLKVAVQVRMSPTNQIPITTLGGILQSMDRAGLAWRQ
jgi:hypothetical protein